MTNGLLIYGKKIAHFLISYEALPPIWLCTRSHLNFLLYEVSFVFFFISVGCAVCNVHTAAYRRVYAETVKTFSLPHGEILIWLIERTLAGKTVYQYGYWYQSRPLFVFIKQYLQCCGNFLLELKGRSGGWGHLLGPLWLFQHSLGSGNKFLLKPEHTCYLGIPIHNQAISK